MVFAITDQVPKGSSGGVSPVIEKTTGRIAYNLGVRNSSQERFVDGAAYQNKIAAYTVTGLDMGLMLGFNSATGFGITIPSAANVPAGFVRFAIATVASSGNHSIIPQSTDTIKGAGLSLSAGGTLTLTGYVAGDTITLMSDGTTTWYVVGLVSDAGTLSPALFEDGTSLLPSAAFRLEPTLGFYRASTGTIGIGNFNVSGRNPFAFAPTQLLIGASSKVAWVSTNDATGSAADLILDREGAGHKFQKNSTNAQRMSIANTYTGATNYEAFSVDWQTTANTALVGSRPGSVGGSPRAMQLVSQVAGGTQTYAALRLDAGNLPFIKLGILDGTGAAVSVASTGTFFNLGIVTSTATSGTFVNTAITPTYNQSASTAANTDLLINRTQTAVGSGQQNFIDAQVSGVTKFRVSNVGDIVASSALYLNGGAFGSISFTSDGVMRLMDNAGTSFSRLQFGGTSSSFPALKRSGTGIQVRLADDSAYGDFTARALLCPTSTGSGIGYIAGAGGTVTQLTNKSTGVTLNTMTGEITMNGAALAGDTTVSFTLTNSAIVAGDHILVQHVSVGTVGSYLTTAVSASGSATVTVRNITTGSLSEAIVLKFTIFKSATT